MTHEEHYGYMNKKHAIEFVKIAPLVDIIDIKEVVSHLPHYSIEKFDNTFHISEKSEMTWDGYDFPIPLTEVYNFQIQYGNKVLLFDRHRGIGSIFDIFLLMSIKETRSIFDYLIGSSYRVNAFPVPYFNCSTDHDSFAGFVSFFGNLEVVYQKVDHRGFCEVNIRDGENVDSLIAQEYMGWGHTMHNIFLYKDAYTIPAVQELIREATEYSVKEYLKEKESLIKDLRQSNNVKPLSVSPSSSIINCDKKSSIQRGASMARLAPPDIVEPVIKRELDTRLDENPEYSFLQKTVSDLLFNRTTSQGTTSQRVERGKRLISCNRCGECCVRNAITDLATLPEFKQMLSAREPVIVRSFENGHYISRIFKPEFDVDFRLLFVEGKITKFFDAIDNKDNICPYLDFNINDAVYTCKMQDLKPKVCAKFFCDDGTYSDGREAFGTVIEPPCCDPCSIKTGIEEIAPEFPDDAELQKLVPDRPCETSTFFTNESYQCTHVERRVHFFLAFAKQHLDDPCIIIQGRRLHSMLQSMDQDLRRKLHQESRAVTELNADNYKRYIHAIDAILSKIRNKQD